MSKAFFGIFVLGKFPENSLRLVSSLFYQENVTENLFFPTNRLEEEEQ
jgi:hypothetical protein